MNERGLNFFGEWTSGREGNFQNFWNKGGSLPCGASSGKPQSPHKKILRNVLGLPTVMILKRVTESFKATNL